MKTRDCAISCARKPSKLRQGPRAGPQLRRRARGAALFQQGAERVPPGPERRGALALVAPSLGDSGAARTRHVREALGRAGLADPGLSTQEGDPSPAPLRVVERGVELLQQVVASDEDRPLSACKRCSGRSRHPLDDGRGEPVAPAAERLDQAISRATVPQGAPNVTQRAGQGGLAHDDVGPDLVEDLALGDDPVAVPNQVEEQRERLGLQLHGRTVLAELGQGLVELEVAEGVDAARRGHRKALQSVASGDPGGPF